MSALVGIAIDQGYIGSVNDPVLDYFPDRIIAQRDPRKEAVTLEHLLTMTSGLAGDEGMAESRNWVQYMLNRPVVEEPGTKFQYNSGNIHLLSAIIQETSSTNTWSFAYKNLFKPLGIDLADMYWESDPNNIPSGGWGLWLRPGDLAKIGYLYMHEGTWDGQQLVPVDWVRVSTQPHIQVDEPLEPWDLQLGYCWWLHQPGFYGAHGAGGQFIFIIPEQQMVVVFTSGLKESEFVQPELLVRDFIMPAAVSTAPLPALAHCLTLMIPFRVSAKTESAVGRIARSLIFWYDITITMTLEGTEIWTTCSKIRPRPPCCRRSRPIWLNFGRVTAARRAGSCMRATASPES